MGSPPPNTTFDHLIQQLGSFPLWMKQVIYAQMKHDLESSMSKATLDAFSPEHTLQLWVPELTRQGQLELEKPTGQFEQGVLRLLYLTRFQKNVVNITILNNWSLEQTSQYLLQVISHELVVPPKSAVIMGTVEYLAGKTRLGEYLVKINRLTVEQLDQALRTQKAIQDAMGERTGIANVLINLGYIKREDSEGILFLKEESKKAFQTNLSNSVDPARLQLQLQQAMARIQQLESKYGP
jgi:hypothetical protein